MSKRKQPEHKGHKPGRTEPVFVELVDMAGYRPFPADGGVGAEVANPDNPRGWMARGRCQEVDPDLFFPDQGGDFRPAKQICAGCPVKVACLEYALDHDERFGIYGGLSAKERRREQQRRNRQAIADAVSWMVAA